MMQTAPINEITRLRVRFTQVLAVASIVVALVGMPTAITASGQTGILQFNLLLLLAVIALNGLWLYLVNQRRYTFAELGLITTFTASLLITSIPLLLLASLAMLAAAALGSRRVLLLVNHLVIGRIVLEVLPNLDTSSAIIPQLSGLLIEIVTLLTLSIVIRIVIHEGTQAIASTRRTTNLLQASADIQRIASRAGSITSILDQSVALLRNRFSLEHVQVYLLAEGEGAVLMAAASSPGRALLISGYRVPLGARGAIGQVTLNGTSAIRSYTLSEPHTGEVLDGTQSQLALPMRDGGRTIGVLDLQSLVVNGFTPADVPALQVIADLLATATRSARLYEEQARINADNQRLQEQIDANLREIERLNQELTRSGWQDYIRVSQQTPGITIEQDRVIPDAHWSEALALAQQQRRAVNLEAAEKPVVAVPITLRGEVIGAIEVEPGAQATGSDAVEMVEAVAQRLALSLENARLYEETQQAATQEQRINAISARYQEVTTVDELLRVTLQELSETLQAESSTIRLGVSPQESST